MATGPADSPVSATFGEQEYEQEYEKERTGSDIEVAQLLLSEFQVAGCHENHSFTNPASTRNKSMTARKNHVVTSCPSPC